MLERKLKERQRFQQVMVENEENQRRLREEAERERIEVPFPSLRISSPKKSMRDFKTNWSVRERRRRESGKIK